MNCVSCNEIITTPLCSVCLSERMREMVSEYDAELANEIHPAQVKGKTVCLACGQKMGLCPACFTLDVYELVEEKNPTVAKHFKKNFDFDLRGNLYKKT